MIIRLVTIFVVPSSFLGTTYLLSSVLFFLSFFFIFVFFYCCHSSMVATRLSGDIDNIWSKHSILRTSVGKNALFLLHHQSSCSLSFFSSSPSSGMLEYWNRSCYDAHTLYCKHGKPGFKQMHFSVSHTEVH